MNWDAIKYFRTIVEHNRFAQNNGFRFYAVSELAGFEEALDNMQSTKAFVCVSDVSTGTISLANSPSTVRTKTVFIAMRHPLNDMARRMACFEKMRELFRQLMSHLLRERTRLVEQRVFLHTDIRFQEIDKYFFSGCAAAYFQIVVDTPTTLVFNPDEWI